MVLVPEAWKTGPVRRLLLTALLLTALAAPAGAQPADSLPACSPELVGAYADAPVSFGLPSDPLTASYQQVTVNRDGFLNRTRARGDWSFSFDASVALEASDGTPVALDDHNVAVMPAAGTVLRVRDSETLRPGGSGPQCRLDFFSEPFTVLAGQVTPGTIRSAIWGGRASDDTRGLLINFYRARCADGRVTLQAWSGGREVKATSAEGCELGSNRVLAGDRGLGIKARWAGLLVGMRRSGRVRFRLSYNDVPVLTGSFWVRYWRSKRVGAIRIWDSDFDSYVNLCINGNRTTWAEGGRLYCWWGGSPAVAHSRISGVSLQRPA